MIDSHCHLGIGNLNNEQNDVENVLNRAKQVGVTQILTVACDYDDINDLTKMLSYSNVYGSFGIHPENALKYDEARSHLIYKKIPSLIALGEIGLDYYYGGDLRESQILAFEKQIELASTLNLPVIIHTRDAEDDTQSILKSACNSGLLRAGGVLHCFTASQNMADFALDLGFYISASGIVTFKKAIDLQNVFKTIPLNRLLVETDSPYLAPVPYRGKTNESAYLVYTAEKLAELKQTTIEEIDMATTENFKRLFLREKI